MVQKWRIVEPTKTNVTQNISEWEEDTFMLYLKFQNTGDKKYVKFNIEKRGFLAIE